MAGAVKEKTNNPYLAKKAEILEIFQETEVEYTFRVESDFDLNFGQFLEVSIPGYGEAPISVSNFNDQWLELTIRSVGKLTDEIHNLKAGDYFYLRGPYGNGFELENYLNKNVIIAAGGTGLAPVRSLIEYANNNLDKFKNFELLAGFKNAQSLLFERDLERWRENFELLLTVDETCSIWGECVGLITEHIAELDLDDLANTEIIVVGPPPMMKYSIIEFQKLGIPDEQIWVSYERKMHCGLGKCGHCKIEDNYVCLDGPVYNYADVKELRD